MLRLCSPTVHQYLDAKDKTKDFLLNMMVKSDKGSNYYYFPYQSEVSIHDRIHDEKKET